MKPLYIWKMAVRVAKMTEREKLLLKKYGNRRLYDTKRSAYVTLSQVADIIKQGVTLRLLMRRRRRT